MKQRFKNLSTGDEVVHSPGKTTLQNLAEEKTVEITPTKFELRTGVSQFVRISFDNGIEMQDGVNTLKLSLSGGLEISDGTQTTSLSLLQLLHNNGAGKTNSVTDEQVVLSDGTNLNVMEAGTLNVSSSDGKSSALSPAHLFLDGAEGKTNSITDEQMVLDDGSDMTVIEAGQTTVQNGTGDDVTIKPNEVRVTDGGDNYSSISAEGGFRNLYDGNSAMMYVGSVKLDDGSSGTVDITPVPSQAISFKAPEGCDVDDAGEPITTTTDVLRGEATEV